MRLRAVVRVREDPVNVETLQEEDLGAEPNLEAFRHPDAVTDTGLLQDDVRAALHVRHE